MSSSTTITLSKQEEALWLGTVKNFSNTLLRLKESNQLTLRILGIAMARFTMAEKLEIDLLNAISENLPEEFRSDVIGYAISNHADKRFYLVAIGVLLRGKTRSITPENYAALLKMASTEARSVFQKIREAEIRQILVGRRDEMLKNIHAILKRGDISEEFAQDMMTSCQKQKLLALIPIFNSHIKNPERINNVSPIMEKYSKQLVERFTTPSPVTEESLLP
jgi:hypothetical protein